MTPPPRNRAELAAQQGAKLERLFATLLSGNPFYGERLRTAGFDGRRLPTLEDLSQLPLTHKEELVADQLANPPFGSNLSYPVDDYTRMHQTSGTTGRPLRWLDTRESWQWLLDCWELVLRTAGVTSRDRVFCAFSFGPFIGFWAAFEAAQRMGALALTGGALSSEQRLDHLQEAGATVLLSTPTYAMRLAELARERGIDLPASPVRICIQAGEPGASVPNVRRRLEEAWGARIVDHAGATEVGAWGFACGVEDHMHVNEGEFLLELLDPGTGEPLPPTADDVRAELLLTNLGRLGSPVLRYRTGDLVHLRRDPCPCGSCFAYLERGVLSRLDDMVIVRGTNVYPAAIENVVREFPQVAEFQARVARKSEMSELTVRIEAADGDAEHLAARVGDALRRRLSIRVEVEAVAPGSLPRFELKSRRFEIQE